MDWRARQNGDGGWAYGRGCSWTEPTVFVLLAQSTASLGSTRGNTGDSESFRKGIRFLSSNARGDGGWSPQPSVEESTWVTALVALLPEGAIDEKQRRRALDWLKSRTGRESGWRYRLQQRLGGDREEFPEGWPWFPGAAAWVIPTSLGILAFQRAIRRGVAERDELEERVQEGRRFLLGRMCADGGWNHGSNRALGRDGDSYPETTGIALLALSGEAAGNERSGKIAAGIAAGRKHLTQCRTAEGIAWLRMGLAAHGDSSTAPVDPVCRTNMDCALMALAGMALAGSERNPLVG